MEILTSREIGRHASPGVPRPTRCCCPQSAARRRERAERLDLRTEASRALRWYRPICARPVALAVCLLWLRRTIALVHRLRGAAAGG